MNTCKPQAYHVIGENAGHDAPYVTSSRETTRALAAVTAGADVSDLQEVESFDSVGRCGRLENFLGAQNASRDEYRVPGCLAGKRGKIKGRAQTKLAAISESRKYRQKELVLDEKITIVETYDRGRKLYFLSNVRKQWTTPSEINTVWKCRRVNEWPRHHNRSFGNT